MMNATTKTLLALQRDESTLCEVYRLLAESERDPERRRVLLCLHSDELRHCEALRAATGREVAPDRKRVLSYIWIARILGPTFVVRQIEACERCTEQGYAGLAGFEEIARDEQRHSQALTQLAGSRPLSYISSVVLGLNDALVEFTGALAGFTLALNDPRLVALTGGITGIAAALSMAASEYLSTKAGKVGEKHPLRAALCTGAAYIVTVAVLIAPYVLLDNVVAALSVMLVAALAIIAVFNYYYAVVRCENFRQRFFEMALLSFSIAAVSFLIGYLLKSLTGVEL